MNPTTARMLAAGATRLSTERGGGVAAMADTEYRQKALLEFPGEVSRARQRAYLEEPAAG